MKSHTTNLSWWDRTMNAVTFAEANETKTALTFIKDKKDRTDTRTATQQHHVYSQSAKLTTRVH